MIYITYPSALQYWLTKNPRGTLKKTNIRLTPKPSSIEILDISERLDLTLPISLMVADHKQHGRTSLCQYFTMPSNIAEGSFIRLDSEVAVASPEFCFLLAAKSCEIPRLVEIGNALCASYYLRGSLAQEKREPLTSVTKIRHYLDKSSNCHGIKKARRAIRYVASNSYSPMENKLLTAAFLPFHYGGYGTRNGTANGRITLPESIRKYYGWNSITVDILYKQNRVAVEYDSTQYHTNVSQHNKDNARKTALNQAGYDVCTITSLDIQYINRIEKKFLQLRNMLKLPRRRALFDRKSARRRHTIELLFMNDNPLWVN